MSNNPAQVVTQTVTVKVNDGMCSGGSGSNVYTTHPELFSSIAGVYSSINSILVPTDITSLSTTIGTVSNDLGALENDFYNLVNTEIPLSVTTNTLFANRISSATIANLQSTITYLQNHAVSASGPVDLVGASIYYNNSINIAENSIPLFRISSSEKMLSSIYVSDISFKINQSLRSLDFRLNGVNGPSYNVGTSGQKIGGMGAWVSGKINITPAMYGSTLEFSLPAVSSNYMPTRIRIREGDIQFVYAGNGGGAANPDNCQNFSQIGGGGNAGAIGSNAQNGQSIRIVADITDSSGNNIIEYPWVSTGTGALTSANGVGGQLYAYDGIISPNGTPLDFGNNNLNGSNGANHVGGRGGGNALTYAAGGNGGGGYYAGGGGALICSSTDPGYDYSTTTFAAGGGGGTSYINTSYVTLTGSGLNTSYVSTSKALINFYTNLQTLYGAIRLVCPDGNFIDINNL